jgi:hypothetical protein
MSGHTVLILGAGASLAYGLPLGSGLVAKICELLPQEIHRQHQPAVDVISQAIMRNEEFKKNWLDACNICAISPFILFRQRLVESNPKSIDEFLSRDFGTLNNAFRLIGKLSIAQVISANESKVLMNAAENNPAVDHWYRYLWQYCLNDGFSSLAEVKAKRLRIISFNYDRSLEFFLGKRLAATYLANPAESLSQEKIEKWAAPGFRAVENDFDITHPYGTLGSLIEVPYGNQENLIHHGMEMASKIRVIGEERDGPTGFEKARDWLTTASRVVFLGFSYDATNMERLGLADGIPRSNRTPKSIGLREVFPLTFGFERAERRQLHSKYFPESFRMDGDLLKPTSDASSISELHQDMSISTYLRRYGCLANI